MVADELLKQQHGLESVEEDVSVRDSERQLVRRNYIQSAKYHTKSRASSSELDSRASLAPVLCQALGSS